MDLHGLKGTMMTYDDCLNTVEPVNDTNVVKQDSDYVYKWTTGGVASYASSTAETVTNPTWEKEGYVCRPAKMIDIWDLTMSFDECMATAKPPDASNVEMYVPSPRHGNDGGWIDYKPFPGNDASWTQDYAGELASECTKEKDGKEGFPKKYFEKNGWITMKKEDSKSAWDAQDGPVFKKPKGEIKSWVREEDATWRARILGMMEEMFKEGAITTYDGIKCPSGVETLCQDFKDSKNGPFDCTKTTTDSTLPTTHDQAVAYYKKNYAPDALCAPLKENAPFQCTGSEPKSAAEILSLSYANTQLAFSAFGSIFVFILYKCKKAKDPDFLQEDELLAKLEKLEADNAAMKKAMQEENAAMKKAMEEENAAMKSAMEATNEAIKRLEAGKA
eukprot:g1054.t1